MLIITRKRDQKIKIGDDVWVTVTRVRNGQVALGIEAPPNTNVVRAELLGRDHRFDKPSGNTQEND